MRDGMPETGRAYIADAVAHDEWGAEASPLAEALAAQLDDATVDTLAKLLIAVDEARLSRSAGESHDTWEAVKRHFPGLAPALDLVYCHVSGDAIVADCQAYTGAPDFKRNGCRWRPWPPDPAA